MGKSRFGFIICSVMKMALLQAIITITNIDISFSQNLNPSGDKTWNKHPVYLPDISDIEKLKLSVEPLMLMSVKEIIAEVPTASGINFVGCPNCNGGAQESGVLGWKHGMGNKVRCNYCNMLFPNDTFPNNREKVIIAPGGVRQVYSYYEDPEGRQYFFEPHAWYERWAWIQSMADKLAKIWFATKDNAYGDRAAAIAGRFSQVFPDYAVRYDYPNAPVKFFPADQKWPYEGLTSYRGAKWSWWAYRDIPSSMMNVYDILKSGYDWNRMDTIIGQETDKHIAKDLLRLGYEFTAANTETYSNMSPGMYHDMVCLGRILEDPSMVNEGIKRFREFFPRGFFADGWWKEGTISYHDQTISGLKTVADAISGYSYPVDWKGERFDIENITAYMPFYNKALQISHEAIFPNGRKIPINDTWGNSRIEKTDHVVSRLWPSLGNAALCSGEGENMIMLNINWSGNYGHSHYDNGSIILYAEGEEMLSDIGYTHTKYRLWTTHTASHNTVVIDQQQQDAGTVENPVTGRLKFYDDSDVHVKAIDVDASPSYSVASKYRRRLVMVHAGPGRDYIVDCFDIEGGKDHDWFLHGMCEQEGKMETSIPMDQPVETLVPDWGGKKIPKTQYDTNPASFHAYSFLRDIKTGIASGQWSVTWRYNNGGLRTHMFSPEGTQIFRFRSPSVRLAGENENLLDNFFSNGIMQRHSGNESTFISVHEPFINDPWIKSVHFNGKTLILSYTMNGEPVEDKVILTDEKITVTSTAGWEYYSGEILSGKVEALETGDGKWTLLLDHKAPAVKYVRLDLADGGTRYYQIAGVHGKRLDLVGDPGFVLEAGTGRVIFHTFPHDKYIGPLGYTLFVPVMKNP